MCRLIEGMEDRGGHHGDHEDDKDKLNHNKIGVSVCLKDE